MKRFFLITILIIFVISFSKRQVNAASIVSQTISAKRTDEKIKIDGQLSEQVWQGSGYSDLIQLDPQEGANPTEKTEVFITYNDQGLYVAGKCYHTGKDSISGGIARRDEHIESDWFWFWLDADYDKQSGLGFAVNPDGSIIDQKLYQDIYQDNDWDGIWEAEAQKNGNYWSFEMFIPFNQLRFNRAEEHIWGVNFMRYILANAESNYFSMVPKEENGFVSCFGRLVGIKNIKPPSRLFISPYLAGKIADFPELEESAFYSRKRYERNIGLNIKYGITGKLTLDLALNPDFGQAEVDPAVINLSAFETYYSEKRAFFIEGSDIFRFGANPAGGTWGCYWSDPHLFYSRRIGRQPQASPEHNGETYVPENSTILGAAKISGKIGNWSLGSINGVTQREYALIDSASVRFKEPVEPLTYYGIYRGLREFNEGDQGLGFMLTGTVRQQEQENLKLTNNDNAFVAGIDGWSFFGSQRDWAFMGRMAFSRLTGTKQRIFRLQKSSNHYFQRPDYKTVSLDTNLTSLNGWMGRFGFKKMRGKITGQMALGILSPGFNVNDLGYSQRTNLINAHIVMGYRWLHPTTWYRKIYLSLMTSQNRDLDGNVLFRQVYGTLSYTLPNYYSIGFSIQRTPDGLDQYLTRGGPMMAYPGYYASNISVRTDQRKKIVLSGSYNDHTVDDGGFYHSVNLSLLYKPDASLHLTFSLNHAWSVDNHQWVCNIEDPTAQFGYHYIFANIEQKRLSTTLRADWGITPTLSLQGYFQPFLAIGDYHGFKELAEARTYKYSDYEFKDTNPDFNFKSFRGNVVLRWEYMPGSLFYLVWTQKRTNYAYPGDYSPQRDFKALFRESSNNIFFLKMSYMLNI
ncbi:MAG: DUF5916 domain-containing protein [bacterium]